METSRQEKSLPMRLNRYSIRQQHLQTVEVYVGSVHRRTEPSVHFTTDLIRREMNLDTQKVSECRQDSRSRYKKSDPVQDKRKIHTYMTRPIQIMP